MKIKEFLTYGALSLAAVYIINFSVHFKNHKNLKTQLENCQELKEDCLENYNSSIDEFTRCMNISCTGKETKRLENLASKELYSMLIPGYNLF
jgi:hypothetical protein